MNPTWLTALVTISSNWIMLLSCSQGEAATERGGGGGGGTGGVGGRRERKLSRGDLFDGSITITLLSKKSY